VLLPSVDRTRRFSRPLRTPKNHSSALGSRLRPSQGLCPRALRPQNAVGKRRLRPPREHRRILHQNAVPLPAEPINQRPSPPPNRGSAASSRNAALMFSMFSLSSLASPAADSHVLSNTSLTRSGFAWISDFRCGFGPVLPSHPLMIHPCIVSYFSLWGFEIPTIFPLPLCFLSLLPLTYNVSPPCPSKQPCELCELPSLLHPLTRAHLFHLVP